MKTRKEIFGEIIKMPIVTEVTQKFNEIYDKDHVIITLKNKCIPYKEQSKFVLKIYELLENQRYFEWEVIHKD